MAPEVTRQEHYSYPVDVYSGAMVLFFIVSGQLPFENLEGGRVAELVRHILAPLPYFLRSVACPLRPFSCKPPFPPSVRLSTLSSLFWPQQKKAFTCMTFPPTDPSTG